jgi:long-subunit fatty acid transport protein
MKLKFTFSFLIFCCLSFAVFAEDDGGVSGVFLGFENSVHNYSLGRTGTTKYYDASSYSQNAALLSNSNKSIYFMHTTPFSNFDDIKYQSLFGTYKLNETSGIGMGIGYLKIDDVPGYTITGIPTNSYDGKDMFFSLAYGKKILAKLSLGLDIKYIKEEIASYDRNATTFSLGSVYEFNEDLKLSLIFENLIKINNDYKFDKKKESIPFNSKLELSYMLLTDFVINVQTQKTEYQEDLEFAIGSEYTLMKNFDLRAGYNTKYEEFTLGFGMNYSLGNLNYAYGKNSDLGNTHRFSVNFKFGNLIK